MSENINETTRHLKFRYILILTNLNMAYTIRNELRLLLILKPIAMHVDT